MTKLFESMSDLSAYLEKLEARIKILEEENEKLRALPTARENIDGNVISRYVSHFLPRTNLISPSFFKRAFTVWGHFFVANLIIGIIVGVAYACLMIVLFGSIFGNLIQSQK